VPRKVTAKKRPGAAVSGRQKAASPARPRARVSAKAPAPAPLRKIYVLSDSTGNLPRHMLAAFLTQFPPGTFTVRACNFIDTPAKVEAVLHEVAAAPGIVLHALVDPSMKRAVVDRCEKLGLPACDLTGPFVRFLSDASGVAPIPGVRSLHRVDTAYARRVKAVEFALEHDDGLGLDTLRDADVVLVGISRTSKTPTCMYLAQQGFKAPWRWAPSRRLRCWRCRGRRWRHW
jgi:regulator of PEP synthase PpsR (kinase-PPPase family)